MGAQRWDIDHLQNMYYNNTISIKNYVSMCVYIEKVKNL